MTARAEASPAGQRERRAREAIADMTGTPALPRKSGELVFHHDWERRAFALAVALSERGCFAWDDFREHLVAEIAAGGESAEHPDPEAPGYYEHWLAALEKVLGDRDIVDDGATGERTSAATRNEDVQADQRSGNQRRSS